MCIRRAPSSRPRRASPDDSRSRRRWSRRKAGYSGPRRRAAPPWDAFRRTRGWRSRRRGVLRGPLSWEYEHVERAALRRRVRQVAHGVDEAERGARVPGVEAAGDDRTRPSAHARQNGDVLLAVGPAVRDRLPDDPRARLELPERLAGSRVHGLEPSLHRAVERDVPRGDERAAPHGKVLLDAPDLLACDRIPRIELAAVS